MTFLKRAYAAVREFHITFGHPYSDTPVMQPQDRADARADWITEEADEVREAATICQRADGYIDAIYFGLGGLVEMGIDPDPLFELVHGANMAKVWPDGTVHRREDGKILKPPGWEAPDVAIAAEIDRQLGARTTTEGLEQGA
jgi:predicted HAD superfamily Cof-like phosphohydrolase